MTIQVLDRVAIGRPITRGGISFFPVYLPAATSLAAAAAVGDGIRIVERDDAEVPTIIVTNETNRMVLVPAGSLVEGGRQNRTLNVSVLVPARGSLDVPVSCVESGRWHGGGEFRFGAMFASRRVRREMHRSLSRNLRDGGRRQADQSVVWSQVSAELDRFGVTHEANDLSAVRAVADRDDRHRRVVEDLVARGPLPGQCGVVVCHGSRVVSADLFATPDMFACHWEALVRSHLLEVSQRPRSRPSASRVLDFLHAFASSPATVTPGVGLGRELHVDTERLAGQALVLDGALVHASMFAVAA